MKRLRDWIPSLAVILFANGQALGDYKPNDMVLLQEITASNSATVNFTSIGGGQYKLFVIEYRGVKPATDDTYLRLRMTTNGGSTWASGASDYAYRATFQSADGGNYWRVSTAADHIALGGGAAPETGWGMGNGTDENGSGYIRIWDPANTGIHKVIRAVGTHTPSDVTTSNIVQTNAVGRYLTTTAVNGFQLSFNSGNISSGVFRLYGRR